MSEASTSILTVRHTKQTLGILAINRFEALSIERVGEGQGGWWINDRRDG